MECVRERLGVHEPHDFTFRRRGDVNAAEVDQATDLPGGNARLVGDEGERRDGLEGEERRPLDGRERDDVARRPRPDRDVHANLHDARYILSQTSERSADSVCSHGRAGSAPS